MRRMANASSAAAHCRAPRQLRSAALRCAAREFTARCSNTRSTLHDASGSDLRGKTRSTLHDVSGNGPRWNGLSGNTRSTLHDDSGGQHGATHMSPSKRVRRPSPGRAVVALAVCARSSRSGETTSSASADERSISYERMPRSIARNRETIRRHSLPDKPSSASRSPPSKRDARRILAGGYMCVTSEPSHVSCADVAQGEPSPGADGTRGKLWDVEYARKHFCLENVPSRSQ